MTSIVAFASCLVAWLHSNKPPARKRSSVSKQPLEVAQIKALLHARPSHVLPNCVLPPVAPPRRYKLRPVFVGGKQVPFTLKVSRRCGLQRHPLHIVAEGPTRRQLQQRTTLALAKQRAYDPERAC